MEYTERTYREMQNRERWRTFTVAFRETDLWIGVDTGSFREDMPPFVLGEIESLRKQMDDYLKKDPCYAASLVPYAPGADAPGIFADMSAAAARSGTGPMSAVAGAIARRTGEAIRNKYGTREVVVENGGDIYADIREDMDISVFAGCSPLSGRVGVTVRAEDAPLGICTSSGTVGHSFSFGRADAVMIVCRDTALADAYATAFANRITVPEDIDDCIAQINEVPEILGAICIKDDKMAVSGIFDLKLWK